MKFTYLGTSTAEGFPTMFCKCPVCERTRSLGGRNIRTRMQAMIDGRLLIDFGPDTMCHFQREGLCLADMSDVLITHSHTDHLYPVNIRMMEEGYAHPPKGAHITFHGTAPVREAVRPFIEGPIAKEGTASFHEITPFVPFTAGDYTVTALPATHDPSAGSVLYQITDGVHTVLFAHDTGLFDESLFDYWRAHPVHLDFVSIDCTYGFQPTQTSGHMNFEKNKQMKKKLYDIGIADDRTRFSCSHFSHNGGAAAYDDFLPIAEKEGFLTSFDGMTIDI